MARPTKQLDRLLRVRTLQLGLVRAEEAGAVARVASETALRDRIAQLSAHVAPAPSPTPGFATTMMAQAHLRERLHISAVAADERVASAYAGLAQASGRSKEARRDQHAVEKLLARAQVDAALRELRALEDLPATAPRKRHDPC